LYLQNKRSMKITDIYEVNYQKNSIGYIALLGNQKRFNIGDNIWFSQNIYQYKLFRGIVKGIELVGDENPDYKYKIEIPEQMAKDYNFYTKTFNGIVCDSMFGTIEEAEESAKLNCEATYVLQKQEIENYFSKFKTKDKLTK
jgi:hypothetical protein